MPTPGGPASASTAPLPAAALDGQALVGEALADGQVLDDPVLDLVQAGVVGVEHGAGAGDVVGVVGAGVPRHVQDGVEPGADPAGLGGGVRAALQLGRLAQRGLADVLRQVGGLDPSPVVVLLGGRGAVELGQLLADRGELLAQQELALLLLHALADVVADRLGHVQLGQVIAGPAGQPLEPLLGVDRLQQLGPLLGRQIAGVAGAVGQRGRIGDPVKHVNDLERTTLLQDRGR